MDNFIIKKKILSGRAIFGYILFNEKTKKNDVYSLKDILTLAEKETIQNVKLNNKKTSLIGDGLDLRKIPTIQRHDLKKESNINLETLQFEEEVIEIHMKEEKKEEPKKEDLFDVILEKEMQMFSRVTGLPATLENLEKMKFSDELWAINITDPLEKAYKYLLCECKYSLASILYKNNYPINIHLEDIHEIDKNINWRTYILEIYGIHKRFNTIAQDFQKQVERLGYSKQIEPYSIVKNIYDVDYIFMDVLNQDKKLTLSLQIIINKKGLNMNINTVLLADNNAISIKKHFKKIEQIEKDLKRKYNLVSLI